MLKQMQMRKGFTMIELLMVISIMAVVATLATTAALKSLRASREKRIDAMACSLETALVTYRALSGKWSFEINDNNSIDNQDAFKEIFEAVRDGKALLEPASLLTRVNGRRMSVREAMENGIYSMPVGYPNPDKTEEFILFKVSYNRETESVKVSR